MLVPGDAAALTAAGRLEDVVRFEAERARGWYATGLRLMPLLDRRSAASAGAMAGIYFRLLGPHQRRAGRRAAAAAFAVCRAEGDRRGEVAGGHDAGRAAAQAGGGAVSAAAAGREPPTRLARPGSRRSW